MIQPLKDIEAIARSFLVAVEYRVVNNTTIDAKITLTSAQRQGVKAIPLKPTVVVVITVILVATTVLVATEVMNIMAIILVAAAVPVVLVVTLAPSQIIEVVIPQDIFPIAAAILGWPARPREMKVSTHPMFQAPLATQVAVLETTDGDPVALPMADKVGRHLANIRDVEVFTPKSSSNSWD